MIASEGSSADRSELLALLVGLRREALLPVIPTLIAAGCLIMANSARLQDPLHGIVPGLLLYLVSVTAWALGKRDHHVGAWALAAGCVLVDLVLVQWARVNVALCLLAVPAGLATLSTGIAGGVVAAVLCTLLLWLAPPSLLPADTTLRLVSAIALWSTVGMIWLAARPLLTTLAWSWSSYRQSRHLLEQARDYQVKLKQTLQDLADANLQLTRLNHLAQGLRQTAEEARLAKEQFVANVSHELRTPLNMIIGFGEMILQAPKAYGGKIPAALSADLAVIVRNSQHLASLIDDVLDLSQIEAGQMALTRERVALREIIDAAAAAVRPLYESKGLYLRIDAPENLTVFCDRTRIREVVLNLLSNAGRFTERGGVSVRAWQEGDTLVVSVADTGPGIDAAGKAKLFQPFQQLDGSLRRRYGGSGLGLCISKSFVELHGGRMWVESTKDSGSTFYFSLPANLSMAEESATSRWFNPHWHYEERTRRSLAPVPALQPRFVILEQGNTLQRLLSRYMDGVEIASAASLEEAVQELARAPAQALLVNGPSAHDTLHRLKESAGLPYGTPAVLCDLPSPTDAANALGVADYLVKPVSPRRLLASLGRLHPIPKTVLVVDDEPEAQHLLWRILASSDESYRVLTTSDARDALGVLREEQVGAILLDLVMPEMDGFQFLEARSQDPALRAIPVIVLSARDPEGQPIVSNAVTITRGGGLSVPQVLRCIQVTCGILGTLAPVGSPTPPADQPG